MYCWKIVIFSFFFYLLWVIFFLIYQMYKSSDFWYRLIFWRLQISNSLILSLYSSVFPLIFNLSFALPMIMIGFSYFLMRLRCLLGLIGSHNNKGGANVTLEKWSSWFPLIHTLSFSFSCNYSIFLFLFFYFSFTTYI
jgi:hypothetical protein